jgi:hypothetical protein
VRREVVLAAGREERVVLERGAPVGVRFVEAGSGRPLSADDVRAAFARSGIEPHAELVWDGALSSTDAASFFRTLFGDDRTWRRPAGLEWSDGGLGVGERLSDGMWRLMVWRPDGTPFLSEPFHGGGEDDAVTVPIGTAPPRRVRLLDAQTGAPLPGAKVRAFHEHGDDQAFLPGPVLVADGRGEVDVPAPAPPTAGSGRPPAWWAEAEGRAGRLPSHGDGPVEVRLERTATVAGTAHTSEGAPAIGLEVVVPDNGRVLRAVVGPDGRFRLTGVATRAPEGRADVVLLEDLGAGRIVLASVATRPGETSEAVVGTPPSAAASSLEGVVTAGGRPLAGVFVTARGADRGPERFARTDGDGRFRMPGLSAGPARVRLYLSDPRASDDFHVSPAEGPTLVAGETRRVEIALPGGALRVRIVDRATGAPVPGAAASARPEPDDGDARDLDTRSVPGWAWRPGAAAFAGEDGTALLVPLPSAAHAVAAQAPGYEPAEASGVLPGTRERPAEVTLRLARKP